MPIRPLNAVIFDVDGVLLDSLTPHLAICRDKSEEFGLGLKIPDAEGLKAMVRRGVVISPMDRFFQAVGFSAEDAARATADYLRDFMRVYAPAPFKNVDVSLRTLHDAGLPLGIVTANFRKNIASALGDSMTLFDAKLIYTHDDMEGKTKATALREISDKLKEVPGECVYVGDQPADWRASREAGCQFVGVTYGWGISKDDTEYPTFSSLEAVCSYLLEHFAGAPMAGNPLG